MGENTPLGGPSKRRQEAETIFCSATLIIYSNVFFMTKDVNATGLYSLSDRGDSFFGTGTIIGGFHRQGAMWSWSDQ